MRPSRTTQQDQEGRLKSMALTPYQIGEGCRKLEQKLTPLVPCAVRVTPTRSAHTWVSYRMHGRDVIEIRVTPALLDAPQPILQSMVDWIYRRGDRGEALDTYFETIREHWREYLPPLKLKAAGSFHDLKAILDRVLAASFRTTRSRTDLALPPHPDQPLAITWGRRAPAARGAARQRVVRLGSWDCNLRLIRIHPCLDRVDVPGRFVEFIVFHEALHAAVPPIRDRAGRRRHHHKEFRAYERRHPAHDWAEKWEVENISRLIKTPGSDARTGQAELF